MHHGGNRKRPVDKANRLASRNRQTVHSNQHLQMRLSGRNPIVSYACPHGHVTKVCAGLDTKVCAATWRYVRTLPARG